MIKSADGFCLSVLMYIPQVYTKGSAVTCPALGPANLSAQIGHQHSRAVFYVWPRTIAATASFHSP